MPSTLEQLETLVLARHPLIVAETPEEDRLAHMILTVGQLRNMRVYLWDAIRGLIVQEPVIDHGSIAHIRQGNPVDTRERLPKGAEFPPQVTGRPLAVQRAEWAQPIPMLKALPLLCQVEDSRGAIVQHGVMPHVDEYGHPTRYRLDASGSATDYTQRSERSIYVLRDLHPFLRDPLVVRALKNAASDMRSMHKTIILVGSSVQLPSEIEKESTYFDFPLPDREQLRTVLSLASDSARSHPAKRVPVQLSGEDTDHIVRSLQGLTQGEAEMALTEAIISTGEVSPRCLPWILGAKQRLVRKTGFLQYIDESVQAEDFGEYDVLKDHVAMIRDSMSEAARQFGVPRPRAMCMAGFPGTGKSYASGLVGAGMPRLRLNLGDLMTSALGGSESALRKGLKLAEAVAGNSDAEGAILEIDEGEKFFGSSNAGENDGMTSQRMLGTFLTWMQEHKSGIYIVMTVNRISKLPPELLRRFDLTFWLGLPSIPGRREIFDIHIRKVGRNPDYYDLDLLASDDWTRHFTGYEIQKVVAQGLQLAWRNRDRDLSIDHLLTACQSVKPVFQQMQDELAVLDKYAAYMINASSRSGSADTKILNDLQQDSRLDSGDNDSFLYN